ncbi:hypothetical protein FN846DRAFT_780360 [Sphaerosporella brunnea]|uniref:Uncharacterized protein n=1 Tax=Sphaerosporella brunnea TaxID=1250544 RepID=A0A5J5ET30_9PEZI|nr:hypothetical protein FN846DRAFT_780360 [Sphaerosporella brunnea]
MPRSNRGPASSKAGAHTLLIPFALAALASAGLYFFSSESPPSSYPGSDSEHESRHSPSAYNKRRRSRRADRVHDHITEEDTDAFEESRREEEEFWKRRREGMMQYVKGAVEHFTGGEDNEDDLATARSAPAVGTTVPTASAVAASVPFSAVSGTVQQTSTQYNPSPRRKRPIVFVIKATKGDEIDGDFQEVIFPTRSLLSQFPRPLKLQNTNLWILIQSPHLDVPAVQSKPKREVKSTDTLTVQAPEPMMMPSPSLAAMRFAADDFNKSSYEIAREILPENCPKENIKPFTEAENMVPLIREINPDVAYIEEAVVDKEGKVVDEMLSGGWVQTVVVVIGGGEEDALADLLSDNEAIREGRGKWWGEQGAVKKRHGKRLGVVEMLSIEDDWRTRVEEVDRQ